MAALDARRTKLVLGTSRANLVVAFGLPVSWCARLRNAITIIPTDKDDDESMRVFQRVVMDAVANADDDYEGKPHRFTQRSIPGCVGTVYDWAAVVKVTRRNLPRTVRKRTELIAEFS
ncbi:hypothetical protein [Bradyrhizobium iriomotense]|uniref:hypothetical protein n=1 Tax=Bradyrhizobium iriomotense TaxID=441950 RepID=UPI001B8A0A40|nr:hypothetical protein [Bradyrhizobium iriomotense]MBR0779857.1 hypothetical protein [Bradyrhizobium iriomotense]